MAGCDNSDRVPRAAGRRLHNVGQLANTLTAQKHFHPAPSPIPGTPLCHFVSLHRVQQHSRGQRDSHWKHTLRTTHACDSRSSETICTRRGKIRLTNGRLIGGITGGTTRVPLRTGRFHGVSYCSLVNPARLRPPSEEGNRSISSPVTLEKTEFFVVVS